MASLQIRELPEHIYQKLLRQAQRERRSLSQEAVVVLARCVGGAFDPQERRREILRRILAKPQPAEEANLPDPAKLIREDRDQ